MLKQCQNGSRGISLLPTGFCLFPFPFSITSLQVNWVSWTWTQVWFCQVYADVFGNTVGGQENNAGLNLYFPQADTAQPRWVLFPPISIKAFLTTPSLPLSLSLAHAHTHAHSHTHTQNIIVHISLHVAASSSNRKCALKHDSTAGKFQRAAPLSLA